MANNEILPFAGTDTGTNLLTQAEYNADSQRPIGNQPGVARSKLVNKVLRQTSLIASAIAQYFANRQSSDITDSLSAATLAGYMLNAIGGDTQKNSFNSAIAAGTADAITASYTPAVAALTDGLSLFVRATAANTSTTPTFTPNSGTVTAKAIVKGNNLALVAGDIAGAGHWLELQYDSTLDRWVLQNPATGVISQAPPPVGAVRNAKMASNVFTADEVVLKTALGGQSVTLTAVNKTLDVATVGAGGMDTGTAPLSGFVAVYLIYNPTTQTSALLATNATAAAAPEIYGGANMPAGYTYSALVAVLGTDGAGVVKTHLMIGRTVYFASIGVLSNGSATTLTAFSLSAAVPRNAKTWGGGVAIKAPTTTSIEGALTLATADGGLANKGFQVPGNASALTSNIPFENMVIQTEQTAYYSTANYNGNSITANNFTF